MELKMPVCLSVSQSVSQSGSVSLVSLSVRHSVTVAV